MTTYLEMSEQISKLTLSILIVAIFSLNFATPVSFYASSLHKINNQIESAMQMDAVMGCAPVAQTTDNGATLGASGTSSGLACIGCSITDETNLIDTDLANFAAIDLAVGLAATGFVSVKFGQTFPAGTRAGFVADLNGGVAGLLNGVSIASYLNGNLQQTITSENLINLLGIGGNGNITGIFCQEFDELRFEATNILSALATYRVYHSYVDEMAQFPVQCGLATATAEICDNCIDDDGNGFLDGEDIACRPVLTSCETVAQLSDNGATLGASGTSTISLPFLGEVSNCLLCDVNGEANLIDNDLNNAATISIPVGVAGHGYLSVKFGQPHPAGTRAGFVLDVNGGVAGVLNAVTLISYRNGVQQQSIDSNNLINLLGIGGNSNVSAVFCQEFDEIRLQAGALVGLLATYNVYNAYVDEMALFPVQCGMATATFSEICGNCIDDDGDGLLDEEDDDCDNEAPIFITSSMVNVEENVSGVALDIEVVDDKDTEAAGLSYTFTGSADSPDEALFTIDAMTGEITFSTSPNFESPADSNGDNIYQFEIMVTDSGGSSTMQIFELAVTDDCETSPVTLSRTSQL